MIIDKEKFWNTLERVKAGLSSRELIEQSSCFVFKDGYVMTFNDEVACRMALTEETIGGALKFEGAIQAGPLLDLLPKIKDDTLEVFVNEEEQLEFRAKRKRFKIVMESEVFLPIDKVERPGEWQELSKDFTEAVGLVNNCVSKDDTKFLLTCVSITPDHVEACDNWQLLRVKTKTDIPEPILVRGIALKAITSRGMDEFSLTKNWIHFRNCEGCVLSCRVFRDDYPDFDRMLEVEGTSILIPKGLGEAAEAAAIFGQDRAGESQVILKLRKGKIRIKGEGITGSYEEVKTITYEGPDMEFVIAPDLLKHISKEYKEATISQDKLRADGGKWAYVTALGSAEA